MTHSFSAALASDLLDGQLNSDGHVAPRSISVSGIGQLWPDGIIPYTIDSDLSTSRVSEINRAIKHWNKVGGISLLELSEVRNRTGNTVEDSVRFTSGDHCASWVGRRGGQQDLWVASSCPAGSVMHEIGHLLGLEHEHTRPDRNQFIKIHWNNIEPDKKHNFDLAPKDSALPGSYDVDSIMHYGSHNFSRNGKPTITLLDGSVGRIGQRSAPSPGDLQAVAELYGSDLSVVARTAAAEQGTELDIYVTNHTMQGAHDVTVQVESRGENSLSAPLDDQWTCVTPVDGGLSCSRHYLGGGAVERLTLTLPIAQLQTGVNVQITSNTHDNDMSNNISLVALDDINEPSARQPAPAPATALALRHDPLIQKDAVAHVSMGGGANDAISIFGFMLLLVRQAGYRINWRQSILRIHG